MKTFLVLAALCLASTAQRMFGQGEPAKHFIVYLPFDRQGDMARALTAVNLTGITDIYIAFAGPSLCSGPCTVASDFTIRADSHTEADVDAVVRIAHSRGIRVMASIGGGSGGVSEIAQFYNANLRTRLSPHSSAT